MPHNISRRRFVQSAAAVGIGLPTISPSGILAGPSPNERLSFACIGMGGQMRGYLIPELGKIDQQIVAICDVDQRQRESALQVKGLTNAKAYHDYRELLDKRDRSRCRDHRHAGSLACPDLPSGVAGRQACVLREAAGSFRC